jgi:hypothetical protein
MGIYFFDENRQGFLPGKNLVYARGSIDKTFLAHCEWTGRDILRNYQPDASIEVGMRNMHQRVLE